MKKLLWVLVVLTVVLCLPLCGLASEVGETEETETNYARAFTNYTQTEFNNLWENKDERGIINIAEGQKNGLPKDASGKYIVPPTTTTQGTVIDLGDDDTPEHNHSYLVVKEGVKIIEPTHFNISVAEASQTEGELPRKYNITPLNSGGALNVSTGDKVVIIMPDSIDHCFNCGVVNSYENGILTLKGKAETDHTLFSYLNQYHIGGKHFSKTWHINKEDVPIKVGLAEYGKATFVGDFTISGHADGNIYPLFVDMEFVTELDFGGKDSTNATTYNTTDPDNVSVQHATLVNPIQTAPGNLVQKYKEQQINNSNSNEETKHILVHLDTTGTEFSIPLIPVAKIELVPAILEINLSPEFFIELKGTGDIGFQFYLQEGFSYYHKVRVFKKDIVHKHRIHEGPKFANFAADVTGEIYVGLLWGPQLEVLEGALGIGIVYKGGAVFEGTINTNGFDAKDPDQKEWHACEAQCVQGDGHPRLGPLEAVAKCLLFTEPIFTAIEETDYDPFLTFYHSYLFNEYESKWDDTCKCPHKAWRTDVTVTDNTGAGLKGVSLTYTPNISDHYNKYRNLTTNENGYARLYLPYDKKADSNFPNTKFDVAASYQKYGQTFTAKTTLPTKNEWRKIQFQLDTRKCTLSFAYNVGSGKVENMPDPVVFYPGTSENVPIPTKVPTYSGFTFLGWSKTKPTETTPIPQGPYYPAGGVIELDDDCTLYAIWNVNGRQYFEIIYLDNGGSKGPGREVWLTDAQEVRISTTKPISPMPEDEVFLGWSTSQNDPDWDHLLQPGDLYSGRNTITLYAQYSNYHPVVVDEIRFHANGDDVTSVPHIQYVKMKAWSRLTRQVPVWDPQHIFLGWSRVQEDTVGRYFPGRYHYFSEDTDLYAIWQRNYHIIEAPTNTTYLRYSGRTLRYVGSGNYKYFNYLAINGLPTAESNYNLSSGSTVIDLKPEFLDTLADGRYSVNILYQDGETEAAYFDVETVHYHFEFGDGQSWTKGSDTSLLFIIKGDEDDGNTYNKFEAIRIDGQLVSTAHYAADPGSLKLRLLREYLQTLPEGNYKLAVYFSDGKAEGTFRVDPETLEVPKTGDPAQPILWFFMMLLPALALSLIRKHTGKR